MIESMHAALPDFIEMYCAFDFIKGGLESFMIIGAGTDILQICRMEKRIDNPTFMRGVFTQYEREYIFARGRRTAIQRAAGIFCAKEACIKALGQGICSIFPSHVMISHDNNGAPLAKISQTCGKYDDIDIKLSISHSGDYAVAFAVACRDMEK